MQSKYEQVLLAAWQTILGRHRSGEISLQAESDVLFHLFAACLSLMQEDQRFEKPYDIFPEFANKFKKKRADLVMNTAEDMIVVEVKMTAPSGMNKNILEQALKDLDDYVAQGASCAYLLYLRKSDADTWRPSFLVGEEPARLVASYDMQNTRYEAIQVRRGRN